MPNALLTTLPSDAHGWNLVFLEMLLQEQGFNVTQLGICTPVAEVLRACDHGTIDLVVVSTVNGHGHLEAAELAATLRARHDPKGLPMVIGGKLGILGDNSAYRAPLLAAGYNCVYDEHGLDDFLCFLVELRTGLDADMRSRA